MATLKTNYGDIKIKLNYEAAPTIAENFATLAQAGKYDNTIFHRVIEGFMIQGGDYENHNGTGGQSSTGEYLKDEFSPDLSHTRGAVSMANKGPNTNGSQFFIVHEDATFLDGRHSIFGTVVEGMDTVDKIATAETDLKDAPLERVIIESVIMD
jgi:cyclophilin family peptidyl-prolyl cis-trans isomerase